MCVNVFDSVFLFIAHTYRRMAVCRFLFRTRLQQHFILISTIFENMPPCLATHDLTHHPPPHPLA